jgi:hypothetical protein
MMRRALMAVSGTKIPPLAIVLAAMIVAGLPLEVTETNVREKVVPEPETERQKTAAALGDPKSKSSLFKSVEDMPTPTKGCHGVNISPIRR